MMQRPNILLVSIHPLRAAHLSCYGYHRQTTPNLDRIAAEGTLFERAYTTAWWTPPAFASLLTGLYPYSHGTIQERPLSNSLPTMPQLLGKMGYRTVGIVGMSGLGAYRSFDRGFDEFVELWRARDRWGGKSRDVVGALENAARLRPTVKTFLKKIRKALRTFGVTDLDAALTTRTAVKWLKDHPSQQQPFFMLLNYWETHAPCNAPHPYRYRYLSRADRALDWKSLSLVNVNPYLHHTGTVRLTQRDFDVLTALYDAELYYLDRRLGQLFDFMRETRLLDSTLVVIVSLHGDSHREHLATDDPGFLYETELHVPLIMRWPKSVPSGMRIQSLVQTTDIFPTVLEAAGYNTDQLALQGSSLFPLEEKRVYRSYVFAEREIHVPPWTLLKIPDSPQRQLVIERCQRSLRMIREGDYKYVRDSNNAQTLFNLRTDPQELRSIATEEPGRTRSMADHLDTLLRSFEHRVGVDREQTEHDVLEDLRAWGYRV